MNHVPFCIPDDNGNPIFSIRKDRLPDATGTGELTGTTGRISYSASYYDAADRLTASVDVGTNGGSAYTRPSTVPTRSDTVLVTSYGYNDMGLVETVTDPKGIAARTEYDNLGRTVKTIAAYSDGTPTDSTNQTTTYTYDGNGNVLTMTAVLPSSEHQTTQYVYGASQSRGDKIDSNDLLIATRYPDKSSGDASTSEQDSYTVDALGERTSYSDRNGSVHAYSYDVLGRLTLDAVTTLGSGVDGSVRALGYSYSTQGLAEKITSYSDAAATTVVNQVQQTYNGLGQLTGEYQEHSGAVNTSTTPEVQYDYSGLDDGSRLTSMTYPNGRVLRYEYSSGLDDSIGRLSFLADDSSGSVGTHLEEYEYLGLSILNRLHPESGVDLNATLDDFGRVADQQWTDGTNDLDRYQYGYDRDGNVLYKQNAVSTSNSELYSYDNLNRLSSFDRGTLNTNKDGLSGSASRSQSWDLDPLGNSDSVTTDGVQENRTHNDQNQLTEMGSSTLAFDDNGNETTDQNGKTFVYDAWNRQIEVKNGSTSLVRYAFDALNRRITEGANEEYYSNQWQQIEERDSSGNVIIQSVWSPVFVDAMVERDRDTNSDGVTDERLYVTQDANFNVTALVSTSGTILQRFQYDPYGKRTVLNGSWSVTTDAYVFLQGHQGGKTDPISGKMYFRNRIYDVDQMRWMQEDPAGYVDGNNLYQFVRSNSITRVDPVGLGGITDAVTLITSTPDYQSQYANLIKALDGRIKTFAKDHACGNDRETIYYHGSIEGQVGHEGNWVWWLYGQATIGRYHVNVDASADVTWSTSKGTTTVEAAWTISMTCIDPWHLHTTWLGWDPAFYQRNWNWTEYRHSNASVACQCESGGGGSTGGRPQLPYDGNGDGVLF